VLGADVLVREAVGLLERPLHHAAQPRRHRELRAAVDLGPLLQLRLELRRHLCRCDPQLLEQARDHASFLLDELE
jgi:hypothetical protein